MNGCVVEENATKRKRKRKRSRRNKENEKGRSEKRGEKEDVAFFYANNGQKIEEERERKRKSICVGHYFLLLSLSVLFCSVLFSLVLFVVLCFALCCCRGAGPRRAKKRTGEEKKGKVVELRGLVQQAQENDKKCSQGCSRVARVVLNRPLARQVDRHKGKGQLRPRKGGGCASMYMYLYVFEYVCAYNTTYQHMLANRLLSKKRPLTLTNLQWSSSFSWTC